MNPKRAAAWVAVCVGCVAGFEGLRTVAYRDASPAEIWTVCYGETKGITKDSRYTPEQCKEMLGARIEEFGRGVDACVKAELPPERKAAFTSTAYNIGIGAFCKSSIVRKINAGDVRGACDELLRWVKAGGITLPGLVKRREQERQLCLKGLT